MEHTTLLSTSGFEKMKTSFNIFTSRNLGFVIIAIFFIVLWAPFLQMIFHIVPEVVLDENRRRAALPELKVLSFRGTAFQKAFEQYYMDHFGFRNALIYANNYFVISTFGVSPHPNVGIGKNGWYYYDYPHDGVLFSDFSGLRHFSSVELSGIAENLDTVNSLLKNEGITFVVFIIPDKQTIYPEFMSDSVPKIGKMTRLDQALQYLQNRKPHLIIIDPRAALLAAKQEVPHPLYCRTDTHWNFYGSFIAYRYLLNTLPKHLAISAPTSLADYSVSRQVVTGGDLAKMLSMERRVFEEEFFFTRYQPVRIEPFDTGYHVPNSRGVQGYFQNNTALPRLMMYHDSFAEMLLPFLSPHFSRSIFLWTHIIDFELVRREKPDILLFEIVERDLANLSQEKMILQR